ncbi:MAG TPA: DUF6491 family protein, partial [Rhizomicrobium sp.]|nr:DUF6491 family protein [Rhizomicrobium sp.]
MRNRLAFAALAAALLLSGQAMAAGTCLRQSEIYNWNSLNDRTVIVEDNFHQKFKLSLLSPCLNMQFKERLGFKTFGGTALSCVSRGDDVIAG